MKLDFINIDFMRIIYTMSLCWELITQSRIISDDISISYMAIKKEYRRNINFKNFLIFANLCKGISIGTIIVCIVCILGLNVSFIIHHIFAIQVLIGFLFYNLSLFILITSESDSVLFKASMFSFLYVSFLTVMYNLGLYIIRKPPPKSSTRGVKNIVLQRNSIENDTTPVEVISVLSENDLYGFIDTQVNTIEKYINSGEDFDKQLVDMSLLTLKQYIDALQDERLINAYNNINKTDKPDTIKEGLKNIRTILGINDVQSVSNVSDVPMAEVIRNPSGVSEDEASRIAQTLLDRMSENNTPWVVKPGDQRTQKVKFVEGIKPLLSKLQDRKLDEIIEDYLSNNPTRYSSTYPELINELLRKKIKTVGPAILYD